MKILIATAAVPPTMENFNNICDLIRKGASEGGLEINRGIIMTDGPGCANVAMDIVGDDQEVEKFATNLARAFMPSKWCTTNDELPESDTCTLKSLKDPEERCSTCGNRNRLCRC